jgi:hypothetical protein
MSNATELLRRARNVFGNCRGDDAEDLFDEICAFLAAESEAEPIEWVHVPLTMWKRLKEGRITAETLSVAVKKANAEERSEPEVVPAKKPMNGDELLEGFDAAECSGLRSFTEGVRWAEEFHGIGVEEE